MRPTLFALPLLAATIAFGQAQQPSTAPVIVLINPNLAGNCPVAMTAQQNGEGQTLWTIALEDARNPKHEAASRAANSGVHVELNARAKSAIRKVDLAVEFIAPGSFILPAASATVPKTLKKTFHLNADDIASQQLVGDLLVGPSASITRVHLLGVTYADGTKWSATADKACSIEPNRVIRVATR